MVNIAKSSQWLIAEGIMSLYTIIWGIGGLFADERLHQTLIEHGGRNIVWGYLLITVGIYQLIIVGICYINWYRWTREDILIASRGRMFACFLATISWAAIFSTVLITNDLWYVFALVAICPFHVVFSAIAFYTNSKVAHALDGKVKTPTLEFRL